MLLFHGDARESKDLWILMIPVENSREVKKIRRLQNELFQKISVTEKDYGFLVFPFASI